jgi:hypothetical protein
MVVPTTVKLAPDDTNTFPTDAVIKHTPFEGTKILAEVAKVTGDDDVHVWYGVHGGGLLSTSSGIDWTNVANWPFIVLNFSEYPAPALSWPVLDVKVGPAQIKTIVDMIITMTTINTSASIVLIALRERRKEENIAATMYYATPKQKEPVTMVRVSSGQPKIGDGLGKCFHISCHLYLNRSHSSRPSSCDQW